MHPEVAIGRRQPPSAERTLLGCGIVGGIVLGSRPRHDPSTHCNQTLMVAMLKHNLRQRKNVQLINTLFFAIRVIPPVSWFASAVGVYFFHNNSKQTNIKEGMLRSEGGKGACDVTSELSYENGGKRRKKGEVNN